MRLALFVQMVQNRTWHPETLVTLGRVEGIGVKFLEELFGRAAPVRYRVHSQAVISILQALLPDRTTAIRGPAQSRSALLAAAGYETRQPELDEVLDSWILSCVCSHRWKAVGRSLRIS